MLPQKTTGRLIVLVLVCHIALGCAVRTVRAEDPVPSTPDETIQEASSNPREAEGFEGVAVYYAKRFQGRRTNSGQIFDHNKLTAAHPSLPHGTKVKVINMANDKSVVVRINDRCRKRGYEIIDLTKKAAQELGFSGKGSAKVKIIPLPEE
ncbi:MAG: septal ring lytic transglycosylase RlpA family protein [Syntrophaceae bacterium]